MAKRKASVSTPGEGLTIQAPVMTAAALEEHRRYLLESAGVTESDSMLPPVVKKQKASPKKSKKDKVENVDENVDVVDDAEVDEAAKTSATPRNAAAKKFKAIPKRKVKAETTDDEAITPTADADAETTPKAKKGKAAPKKRNLSASTSNDDSSDSQKTIQSKHDSAAGDEPVPTTPKIKKTKAPTKKRKAAEDEDGDTTEGATPQKRTKRTTTKKVKSEAAPEPELPQPPKSSVLTPTVSAKVQRVSNFLAIYTEDESLLGRDSRTNIHVPLLDLQGALMRMHQDYELDASVADGNYLLAVNDAVVEYYNAPVKQNKSADLQWIVINPEAVTNLETKISEKLTGWGYDDICFLEIELEMKERQIQKREVVAPTPMGWGEEQQKEFDERYAKILLEQVEKEDTDTPQCAASAASEEKKMGVCPTSPIEPL